MQTSKEVTALLQLIDDPDTEIFDTVAARIMDYGKAILPQLEQLREVTDDEAIQKRIASLIHRVNFQNLQQDFLLWSQAKHPELLRGAILIARYQFPDLKIPQLLTQFDQFRKNIWLELNNYMTPLEQVNVFNATIYEYYKMYGHELTERNPKHFFINHLLDTKQGNAFSIGVLYLAICEILDIPIFAVEVPRQFIFAYIDTVQNYVLPDQEAKHQILFFIDPTTGMLYTTRDVDAYLKKINAKDKEAYFMPINSKRIMYKMLEELALCYRYNHEDHKADEIQLLMRLLVE